jgi:hypothetical protein
VIVTALARWLPRFPNTAVDRAEIDIDAIDILHAAFRDRLVRARLVRFAFALQADIDRAGIAVIAVLIDGAATRDWRLHAGRIRRARQGRAFIDDALVRPRAILRAVAAVRDGRKNAGQKPRVAVGELADVPLDVETALAHDAACSAGLDCAAGPAFVSGATTVTTAVGVADAGSVFAPLTWQTPWTEVADAGRGVGLDDAESCSTGIVADAILIDAAAARDNGIDAHAVVIAAVLGAGVVVIAVLAGGARQSAGSSVGRLDALGSLAAAAGAGDGVAQAFQALTACANLVIAAWAASCSASTARILAGSRFAVAGITAAVAELRAWHAEAAKASMIWWARPADSTDRTAMPTRWGRVTSRPLAASIGAWLTAVANANASAIDAPLPPRTSLALSAITAAIGVIDSGLASARPTAAIAGLVAGSASAVDALLAKPAPVAFGSVCAAGNTICAGQTESAPAATFAVFTARRADAVDAALIECAATARTAVPPAPDSIRVLNANTDR